MTTPWWLKEQSNFDPEQGSSVSYVDIRTGQPVYQQGGKYYSQAPTADRYDWYGTDTSGGYGLVPGAPGVEAQDSPLSTATWLTNAANGIKAPYGNLGGEVGLVNGKATYLYPMERGATIDGAIGMYGGAQRASWMSPSGAKGTVVRGPDGNLWVQPPADARYGESDTADHSTVIGNAIKDFGPLVAAALPFTGIGSAISGALGMGGAGASAITGGLNALVTGGDPLKGAAMGGINSLVKSGVGSSFPPTTSTGGAMADDYSDWYGNSAGTDYSIPDAYIDQYGNSAGTDYSQTGAGLTDFYGNDSSTAGAGYSLPSSQIGTGSTNSGSVPSWLSNLFKTPGLAGALVSGAGGLLAANMTGNAAERAAALAAGAGDRATALQAAMYADQQAKQQPFYQAGVNALAKYQDPSLTRPFSMADFNADPGYGFRVSEGLKALDRQAAARGGLISGSALKGAQNYGQAAASQEYQNAYNRYGQDQATQRNTLANIAGYGPPAAAATGNAGSNYATNTGNIGMSTAGTQANAGLASTAAQASAYGGIANSLGKVLSPDPLTAALTAMMQKQYGV